MLEQHVNFTNISGYGITIGDLGLLLPTHTASRIVDLSMRLCRLPNTPDWLLGMLSISGDAVPLFDLAKLLELSTDAATERYVIVGESEQAIAIGIRGYPQRVRLKATDQLTTNPPLPKALEPYVQSVYHRDQVWVSWDFAAFFTTQGQRLAHNYLV
jgi:twitching motility protein PilI